MIFFLKEKPASGTHISVAGFSSLKIAEKRLKKQKIIYIKEVFPMSNTPNPVYEKLMKCYESFRSQIDFQPEVALILGSGLGDFAMISALPQPSITTISKASRFPLFRATRAVLSSATSAMCRLSACRAAFIIMKAIR